MLFGGLESLRGERILLLAKAKSSKNFYAPRARFWDFGIAFCEILRRAQNLAKIKQSRFVSNLEFCEVESASFGGLESLRGEGILLLAKAKSSKRFCALCAKFCELGFWILRNCGIAGGLKLVK